VHQAYTLLAAQKFCRHYVIDPSNNKTELGRSYARDGDKKRLAAVEDMRFDVLSELMASRMEQAAAKSISARI
jgi:hypothetical protein